MAEDLMIVSTKSELYALQNHTEGECIYCEEDGKVYSWQEPEGWGPIQFENKGISMNLYDLNKSIISQLETMINNEIGTKMKLFDELHNNSQNDHYMLLCKDYNYYTIFEYDSMLSLPTFGALVCEIISNIGNVKSIEFTETKDAIEIWIQPEEIEEVLVFYLFPYDAGVVYYG